MKCEFRMCQSDRVEERMIEWRTQTLIGDAP